MKACYDHLDVWSLDVNLSVKSSGSEKRRVEDVDTVCGRQDDDVGGARVETVHFSQQLKSILEVRNKNSTLRPNGIGSKPGSPCWARIPSTIS